MKKTILLFGFSVLFVSSGVVAWRQGSYAARPEKHRLICNEVPQSMWKESFPYCGVMPHCGPPVLVDCYCTVMCQPFTLPSGPCWQDILICVGG